MEQLMDVYVDSCSGNDRNSGAKDAPFKTLKKAAELINSYDGEGPNTVKLSPGIYNLNEKVLFNNHRKYSKANRLIIEAASLPDDKEWTHNLMPVIISTEDTQKPENIGKRGTSTSGLAPEVNHVTIRGLKFLGSPTPHNRYYPVRRNDPSLHDLIVTQCMFIGDNDALPIHCPVIANGHELIVDHCVFYKCYSTVVFWNAKEGESKSNAMRYCIVDHSDFSVLWTCQTSSDFECHHNIFSNCNIFHMREPNKPREFQLSNCIITNIKKFSQDTIDPLGTPINNGIPITYKKENVIEKGTIILEKDAEEGNNKKAKNYLHVKPGTFGSDLGAGLFIK